MKQVTANIQAFEALAKKAGITTGQLTDYFKRAGLTMGAWGGIQSKFVKGYQKQNIIAKEAMQSTRRFKTELLSLMFVGGMVAGMFGGYVANGLEMLGITDLLNITMSMFVVQALTPISDALYGIIGFMQSLSPEMQTVIGWVMILVTVFGSLVAGLAIFGMVWPAIAAAFMLVTGAATATVGGVLLFIAAIALIIVILAVVVTEIIKFCQNWDENIQKLKEIIGGVWDKIKEIFSGALKFISDKMAEIISSILGVPVEDVKKAFEDIKTKIETVFNDIVTKALTFGSDIVNAIVSGIESIGKKIGETIDKYIPEPIRKGLSAASSAVGWLTNPIGSIVGTATNMMSKKNDFLMRGNTVVPFSSDDNIMGFKGNSMGQMGSTINFSPTINVSVSASSSLDLDTITDKLSREWVDKLNSMIRSR